MPSRGILLAGSRMSSNDAEMLDNEGTRGAALSHESPAVTAYLQILQGLIARMASNSASCKTWCATLVSAVLVLSFTKGVDLSPLISLIPIAVLFYQDVTYLTLERDARCSYNSFVRKLLDRQARPGDLFAITPAAPLPERARTAASWSVSLFYIPLVVAAIALHFV